MLKRHHCQEGVMGPAEPLKAIPLKPASAQTAPIPLGSAPREPTPYAGMAAKAIPLNAPPGTASPASAQGKMHRVAKQFEAMFMTEMLRQAHPKSQATGAFRTGIGESNMQPFMDQALGDAVAARGGTGLTRVIERALNAAAAAKAGK
jgi:Rod binding domain-containing protein